MATEEIARIRTRRRQRRLGILLGLSIAGIGALWVFRGPIFWGNFDVVDPGRVYRSAQPGKRIEQTIESHELATILNLRGGSFRDAFYRREVQVCERSGVDFYDLHLGATRRPTRLELLQVIELLERCRYPLLIHCKSGADRTGLVSALYRMVQLGDEPAEAIEEFSLAHAHIPLFGPEKLHKPILEYSDWLQESGQDHSPERFRGWVARLYQEDESAMVGPERFDPLKPGPRPPKRPQPARAGSQSQALDRVARVSDQPEADGTERTSSKVSTTNEATSHSNGTSRR